MRHLSRRPSRASSARTPPRRRCSTARACPRRASPSLSRRRVNGGTRPRRGSARTTRNARTPPPSAGARHRGAAMNPRSPPLPLSRASGRRAARGARRAGAGARGGARWVRRRAEARRAHGRAQPRRRRRRRASCLRDGRVAPRHGPLRRAVAVRDGALRGEPPGAALLGGRALSRWRTMWPRQDAARKRTKREAARCAPGRISSGALVEPAIRVETKAPCVCHLLPSSCSSHRFMCPTNACCSSLRAAHSWSLYCGGR